MNTMKIHLYKYLYMSYEPNLYFAMNPFAPQLML